MQMKYKVLALIFTVNAVLAACISFAVTFTGLVLGFDMGWCIGASMFISGVVSSLPHVRAAVETIVVELLQ